MTRKDILNILVSETCIKRQLLPVDFGFVASKKKGEDGKRRNTACSSAVQMK